MFGHVLKAWRKINRWLKAVLVTVLIQFGGIPQMKCGYYCNDPALSHKYTGDTISWKFLLATAALFPLFFMFAVEMWQSNARHYSKDASLFPRKSILWTLYLEYAFGLALDLAVVQVIKVLVGEPRPHFFDVCIPDTECEGSEYVTHYSCTSTAYSEIRKADASRSFPSGHTSVGVHAAVFLVWYLHKMRISTLNSKTNWIIPIAQTFFIFLAVYCGISRIMDRRHHWWDVIAGAALGVFIIAYTIRYKCEKIECFTSRSRVNVIEKPLLQENGFNNNSTSSHGRGSLAFEDNVSSQI